MFAHDDGLLADTVWNEYLELQKEHIQLKAQLVVAEKVCTSLQGNVEELEQKIKELESSEDKPKSSKEDD
tara:strand:+ start:304 stop:513 length:210 start_codon:yes stop_codon:yes gene_type:complete